MFSETIVHKWDIVTIHSRLLYTIVTTNSISSFVVPLSVKGFLVCRRLEKFYTAISSAIDLSNRFVDRKCFGDGWCLMDASRFNYFIRSREVHSMIDDTNFMAASENSLGVWTTIWPNCIFRKMKFWMVPPSSSIGTSPWCPSL